MTNRRLKMVYFGTFLDIIVLGLGLRYPRYMDFCIWIDGLIAVKIGSYVTWQSLVHVSNNKVILAPPAPTQQVNIETPINPAINSPKV